MDAFSNEEGNTTMVRMNGLAITVNSMTFLTLNLFFSFHLRNFDSSIAHLQTALKQIYSWMSVQIFLLLTLPRLNFSKYTTLHSIPLILHATLVLSLMKILLSLIRSHHFLRPAILIFVSSTVSVLTLILKQPVPLLPLLSTPNLTTVTLSTTIFLSLK